MISLARRHVATWFARLKMSIEAWVRQRSDVALPPEDYHGPAPSDLLSSPDRQTLLILLACLNVVEQADLRFISHMAPGASEEERQRSLAWLEKRACIVQRRRRLRRDFSWQRRVEDSYFAITPVGRFLLDQTRASLQGASPNEVSL